MKRKHITAVLLSALMVASSAVSVFAAHYDFTRISDKKVFPLIDVAATPEYLADIAADVPDYTIELKDGNNYPLEDYMKVMKENPTFTEDQAIEELNKMGLQVVSVSGITDHVEKKPNQQLEIGVNTAKTPKTVDELKAMGFDVAFEFTAALPANAPERKTGKINAGAAPFAALAEFEYRVKLSKGSDNLVSEWKKVNNVANLTDLKEVTEAGLHDGTDFIFYMKPGDKFKVKPLKGLNFKGEAAGEAALATVTGATITSDNMAVVFPTGAAMEVRAAAVGTANLKITFKVGAKEVGKVTLPVIVKLQDDPLAKVELLKPDAKYALGAQNIVTVLKDANGIVLRDPINAADVKVSVDGAAVDAADLDVATAGRMTIPVNFEAAGTKSIVVMDKEGKVELGKFDVTAEDVIDTDAPDEYKLSVKIGSLDIKTPANTLEIEVKGFKKGIAIDKTLYHNAKLEVFIDDVKIDDTRFEQVGGDDITDIVNDEAFSIKLKGAPFPPVKPDYKLTLKLVDGDKVELMTPQPLDVSVSNTTTQITNIKLLKPVTTADMNNVTKAEIVAAATAGELEVTQEGADAFAVGMIKEVKYYPSTKVLDIIIEDANGGKNFSLTNKGKHVVAQKIVAGDLTPTLAAPPANNGVVADMTLAGAAAANVDMTFSVSGNAGGANGDDKWDTGETPSYVMTLKAKDGYTFEGIANVAHAAVSGATGATQTLSADNKTLKIEFTFNVL